MVSTGWFLWMTNKQISPKPGINQISTYWYVGKTGHKIYVSRWQEGEFLFDSDYDWTALGELTSGSRESVA